MAFLEEELGFPTQPPIQRSVVCLWGLTGIGKSQIAAGFVGQQLSSHPEREIFWINCESRESFERSVIGMLKSGDMDHFPASDGITLPRIAVERRHALVDPFFVELNRLNDGRWLLVIDGVNGTTPSAAQQSASLDIHSCIRRLNRGYILLTSRRRDVVERYHRIWEVKGLKDQDAASLLKLQIHPLLMEGVEDLVSLLKGLPLALRLATSVISRYRSPIREHLEMWKSRSEACEIFGTDETLYRSMDLSFEELENVDPIAAKILTLFSFLHHHDLWYDICLNAAEDTYPQWLQDLSRDKTPFRRYYPLLADLSFIELRVSTKGSRAWETHPAIQAVARQRVKTSEQEYISCAISLVAATVPRSYEINAWETMRRLLPHVELCWSNIKGGKWGPNANLAELESLGHVFRQVGKYDEASHIYRMIIHGLNTQAPTPDNTEFLADVLTNLGLVYTSQRNFELALAAFEKSSNLMNELGILTPDASKSIMYNKAVVFKMTDRLDEAKLLLENAAAHFSKDSTVEHILMRNERKRLYLRILNDMGEVFLRKGSVPEALKLFQEVYDGQKNDQALTKLGELAKARALLLEVISVYSEWWGRRHLETMRAIDELAWVFMEEGKDKQARNGNGDSEMRNAEELWSEALEFYQSSDKDGFDVANRIEANLRYLCSLRQGA